MKPNQGYSLWHRSFTIWNVCYAIYICRLYGMRNFANALSSTIQLSPTRRTQRFDETSASKNIASPETLRALTNNNKKRTVGSCRYQKAWRHWSQLSIDTIRYNLSQNLSTPPSDEGFSKLWFALGVAADTGEMPSFECAGSRSGYALDFFCRARLLSDVLIDFNDNPTLPLAWQAVSSDSPFESPLQRTSGESSSSQCRMISIGGGPGYDFVASALVATFMGDTVSVSASIFDFEEGWKDVVESMALATATAFPQSQHRCEWGGKCDITKPLSHESNVACLAQVPHTNFFVCQYCVAENAVALRASKLVFFADLFRHAPDGAVVLLTETTPRLWPDFVDLLRECPDLDMEIGFPRNVGRGKSGPQLVLRKVVTSVENKDKRVLLAPDQALMDTEFRRKRRLHERKMNSNWERQRRKVRGAKDDGISAVHTSTGGPCPVVPE